MKKIIQRIYKLIVKTLPNNFKSNLRKVKLIDNMNTFFRAKSKPEFIITDEKNKIFLDANDSLHLSVHRNYEELETNFIRRYIKKDMIAVDIGANIGYYSLLLAKLVGNNGKVYAFEPEPNNFSLLKKNIEENGYKNIISIQKAISDNNGKIKLYVQKDNLGGHTLCNGKGSKSIEINSIKLDDFFKHQKSEDFCGLKISKEIFKDKDENIDFIKMDIEGAEGGAIKGMQKILKKMKNITIIFEFSPSGLKRYGIPAQEVFKMLKKFDFIFYDINEFEGKIKLVNPTKIISDYEKDGLFTNLLCVKRKIN